MSEEILEQYGRVTIYTEANHPSPIYHVDGDIQANPYGDLAALFEDDALEEVMYNGGTQCVKVAHRNHGMCRTNIWIDDESGLQIAKTSPRSPTSRWVTVPDWSPSLTGVFLTVPV